MPSDRKVAPLPPADWDPALAPILKDMKGRPLNVHSLMANHPALLQAWWSFRNHAVNGGALGRRSGELVILRVAVLMKAWYEWASHVERGLACGLSREEIERVKRGAAAPGWSAADAALLAAVDEAVTDHGLSPATDRRLRRHYDLQQAMDIMAIAGMYVILGCMINTWGLKLDPHVAEKLPDDVTQDAFEAAYPR